jgi:hypothetical protein
MAFRPEEITRFQTLADEMAKLIEDQEASSEAVVAYGKIGGVCTRALAANAAADAKRTTRSGHVQKFQTARQTRIQRKKGSPATHPSQTTSPNAKSA